MRQAIAKMKDVDAMFNHPDWKVLVDDKKEGLMVWSKTSSSGLNCLKASGVIEFSPR